jgi:D-methionine transport system ATP-binding protein
MIEVTQVSKIYKTSKKSEEVKALEDVTLKIDKGDIFGIIGHSGAGKSTLLRLLNGLELPTEGTVTIDGKEISKLNNRDLRRARQKIGMIFQHFHLLWSRTVRENIAFPLEIAGKSKQEIKRKVDELLERVGLTDRADAYPAQLSGGQKQRVGIARALANEPDVLLCDEATSALDPETTASILRLLKEINRETGITLVLITHEMSVVRSICNKIAVMENGKVVEVGMTEEVLKNPQHPLTRKFLLEANHSASEDEHHSVTIYGFISDHTDLNNLKKIAQDYQVTIQLVDGEIGTGNNESSFHIRIKGESEQVQKASEQIKLHMSKVEVITIA